MLVKYKTGNTERQQNYCTVCHWLLRILKSWKGEISLGILNREPGSLPGGGWTMKDLWEERTFYVRCSGTVLLWTVSFCSGSEEAGSVVCGDRKLEHRYWWDGQVVLSRSDVVELGRVSSIARTFIWREKIKLMFKEDESGSSLNKDSLQ